MKAVTHIRILGIKTLKVWEILSKYHSHWPTNPAEESYGWTFFPVYKFSKHGKTAFMVGRKQTYCNTNTASREENRAPCYIHWSACDWGNKCGDFRKQTITLCYSVRANRSPQDVTRDHLVCVHEMLYVDPTLVPAELSQCVWSNCCQLRRNMRKARGFHEVLTSGRGLHMGPPGGSW